MHRAITGILLAGIVLLAAPIPATIQTIAGSSLAGDGGPAAQALLLQAEGVAVSPSGVIYIADAADHRIRAISPSGEIRTVAGDGSPGATGDGGPATAARLNSPYGLSLDAQGNLYIADLGNARIRLLSADGKIRTVAGGGDIPASETSEGSPATLLKLKSPRNVLADPGGGFYFSDFDAHRVYYVDFRGTLTVFAGTGTPGYGADNINPSRSSLRNPAGLAFEPLGGVVITESGSQRLRRVSRGVITSYLTDAFRNYPLYSPTGIAFDATGNLYIADARSTGALKRSPQGEITALPAYGRAVAADPRGGALYAAGTLADLTGDAANALSARLLAPAAVAYDAQGNLYIADERAHRVRRVTPAGIITTVAGNGKPAYSGDSGFATKASLNAPRALAIDPTGNLFIADTGNHAIRVVTPDGAINTLAGTGLPGYRGDGGPATAAQLNAPSGLALHPNGDLYVSDTGNHRVRRIGRGGILTTAAGTGTPGIEYDGAYGLLAQLNEPRGLAIDAAGNIYIADSANNRIRRLDPSGLLATLGGPAFSAPRAVAVSPGGLLFVADTGRHRILQLSGETTTVVAGAGPAGFQGDAGPAAKALLSSPASLAFDADGNLAIADLANGRVRQLRFDAPLLSNFTEAPLRLTNAASGIDSPLAPGMLATLLGEAIGPAEPAAASGSWPFELGGVEVFVNGMPAPLLYVSARQVNVQIPAPAVFGRATALIEVRVDGEPRAIYSFPVAASAPGFFAKVIQEDGSINSALNPALRGTIVTCFATGAGSAPAELFEIQVGGRPTQILWAGPMPGVGGVTQINVRLPAGFFPAGEQQLQLRTAPGLPPATLPVFLQ